jgi:hypothetical protein
MAAHAAFKKAAGEPNGSMSMKLNLPLFSQRRTLASL